MCSRKAVIVESSMGSMASRKALRTISVPQHPFTLGGDATALVVGGSLAGDPVA